MSASGSARLAGMALCTGRTRREGSDMRLDEHGRWVSDDGAYIWDEPAQVWQPVASLPQVTGPLQAASSAGAPTAGWPEAASSPGAASQDRWDAPGWPAGSGGGAGVSAVDPLGTGGWPAPE